MVQSISYLLSELDSKAIVHSEQVDTIDASLKHLGPHILMVQRDIEEKVDAVIGELLERKDLLQKTVYELAEKEEKLLMEEKSNLLEHLKALKLLKSKAFENGSEFRELFDVAAERSDSLYNNYSSLYMKLTKMDDFPEAISNMGSIFYTYESTKDFMPIYDWNNVSNDGKDGSFDDADSAVSINDTDCKLDGEYLPCHSDLPPCDLTTCCNCEGQEPVVTDTDWEQWLLSPSESKTSRNDCVWENRLVSQIKSLNLSHEKQQGLQKWLASKQQDMDINKMVELDELAISKLNLHDAWDEIKARPLQLWLKSSSDRNSQYCVSKYAPRTKSECSATCQSALQYEAIKSRPLHQWLKRPWKLEDTINDGPSEKLFNGKNLDFGAWLKRKYPECPKEMETETIEACKRIKGIPLEHWLKQPKPGMKNGGLQMKMEQREKTPVAAKKVDDILCVPINMWLKQAEGAFGGRCADWLVPQSKLHETCAANRDINLSTVLIQFDEVTKSSLTDWIK